LKTLLLRRIATIEAAIENLVAIVATSRIRNEPSTREYDPDLGKSRR